MANLVLGKVFACDARAFQDEIGAIRHSTQPRLHPCRASVDLIDSVEGAGHLVFIFQDSRAVLGWVAFGKPFDHHRMIVIWMRLDRNY